MPTLYINKQTEAEKDDYLDQVKMTVRKDSLFDLDQCQTPTFNVSWRTKKVECLAECHAVRMCFVCFFASERNQIPTLFHPSHKYH
jgi:hypothetical protein